MGLTQTYELEDQYFLILIFKFISNKISAIFYFIEPWKNKNCKVKFNSEMVIEKYKNPDDKIPTLVLDVTRRIIIKGAIEFINSKGSNQKWILYHNRNSF